MSFKLSLRVAGDEYLKQERIGSALIALAYLEVRPTECILGDFYILMGLAYFLFIAYLVWLFKEYQQQPQNKFQGQINYFVSQSNSLMFLRHNN